MYYRDKTETLRRLFGARNITLAPNEIRVDDRSYPIIDDVIICLPPTAWPKGLRERLGHSTVGRMPDPADDIQFTFGEEWSTFDRIVPEQESMFRQYFDLVDLSQLANARVCDLGCGMGRWSYFISQRCREIILVDFADAIFVARRNLRDRPNAIFVMADIRALPFGSDVVDLLFSLGVLHHLPTPALDHVVALRRFSPVLLIYLYYALDNRPIHFRFLLTLVSPVRRLLAGVRNRVLRAAITSVLAIAVYYPLIAAGAILRRLGVGWQIPLYDTYHGRSHATIRQDVYDRFFTRIEQRVTRRQIEGLRRFFTCVTISDGLPYWHFLCER